MGLKCPECGTDNMLTAIFCRGCGKKLNLAEMKPDAIAKDESTKKMRKTTTAEKIIYSVVCTLLVLFILALFCPVSGPKGDGASPDAEKNFEAVKKAASPAATPAKKKRGKKTEEKEKEEPAAAKDFTFTSEDATAVLNKAMGLPRSGSDQVVPSHFSIAFLDGNAAKVVVTNKLFGTLPMDSVCKVTFTCNGKGQLDVTVTSARIGLVPLPGSLSKFSIEKIRPLVDGCNDLNNIKGKVQSASTVEGTLTFKL